MSNTSNVVPNTNSESGMASSRRFKGPGAALAAVLVIGVPGSLYSAFTADAAISRNKLLEAAVAGRETFTTTSIGACSPYGCADNVDRVWQMQCVGNGRLNAFEMTGTVVRDINNPGLHARRTIAAPMKVAEPQVPYLRNAVQSARCTAG